MTTLRSYIDPDEQSPTGPTTFQTKRNKYSVRCGICARAEYVDEVTFRSISEAIESGQENVFRCEVCEEVADEIS